MGKAERIEIEDFVQNIVERMETPEAFEKMISREEECEAQGQESRLRDVLKKEWPVDEKGERIYQITNIYEEKAEELLIVELYTGIHLENGVPCGHFTLYLCGEPDGWKLSETRMMEEKLSSCFCCGGDTGKSGSIRPLLIADADQIIQTDLIQFRQTDGNGDRQLPDAFFISGIHIAVAAEIVGNLADRQIVVRAPILQSLIVHDSSPLRKMLLNGRIKMAESYHTAIAPLKQ